MRQRNLWEADGSSAVQYIPSFPTWKPKVHYCIEESTLDGPRCERDISSPHRHNVSLRFHYILSFHLHLGLTTTRSAFPSGFRNEILYGCFLCKCVLYAWLLLCVFVMSRLGLHLRQIYIICTVSNKNTFLIRPNFDQTSVSVSTGKSSERWILFRVHAAGG